MRWTWPWGRGPTLRNHYCFPVYFAFSLYVAGAKGDRVRLRIVKKRSHLLPSRAIARFLPPLLQRVQAANMSIQIGDFVQLSDDHARYDMTDGVGIRDGSLRTLRDYGRVTNVEARTKLVEVASVTRRDADGAAITWSYGIRQLKRADQSVGE